MNNKFLKAVGFVIGLVVLYTGLWFFAAYRVNQSVEKYYTVDGPAAGITFYGELPKVSGFPGKLTLTYRKGFATDKLTVTFPEIKVSAYPVPGLPLTATAAQGLDLKNLHTHQVLGLGYLETIITIPRSLPETTRQADIQKWQQGHQEITLRKIEAQAQKMQILAKGAVSLDTNLQPILLLDSKIYQYEELINYLVNTGQLKSLPAALALSALNAMAQTDIETNQTFAQFDILLQDRQVFLGPVKTIKVPAVIWKP